MTHLVSGARDDLSLPRDLDVETGEDTHDEEADTGVSDASVERGDEHDGTDGGQDDGADLRLVGQPSLARSDPRRARPNP